MMVVVKCRLVCDALVFRQGMRSGSSICHVLSLLQILHISVLLRAYGNKDGGVSGGDLAFITPRTPRLPRG